MLDARGILMSNHLEIVNAEGYLPVTFSGPFSLYAAMLGRKDQILQDNFFEKVGRNRGLRLQVFSKIDKAIECLKK